MKTVRLANPDDAAAIARIYNQGIEERRATFETEPRLAADMALRIADIERRPLLVACNDDGEVLGWTGLGIYKDRACYAGVGEVSVYLERSARAQGLGRALLEALIGYARTRGYWKLVSRIFPDNLASRALCQACGFREVGVYRNHARLDGRFEDVVIVERVLEAVPDSAAAPAVVSEVA